MAITIDDFSKIWASTSPLTPYAFSDDNYKQGWNFVGATPPSRQMWDFIQKQNDEKLKYLLDNFDDYAKKEDLNDYLPLSGGTMTGAIKGNPFTLTADDGNGNTTSLVGQPDGTFTWGGSDVITTLYIFANAPMLGYGETQGVKALASTDNLNSITTLGTYSWNYANKPTNAPCDYAKMIMQKAVGDYSRMQIVLNCQTPEMYMRVYNGSSWTGWYKAGFTAV